MTVVVTYVDGFNNSYEATHEEVTFDVIDGILTLTNSSGALDAAYAAGIWRSVCTVS